MFTGIVKGTLAVKQIQDKDNFRSLYFEFPNTWIDGLELGASVAINGTCLTVKSIENNLIGFDVIMETLRVTNIGELTEGQMVNVERAAKFNDEIGGHLLSGHVHDTVEIIQIERPDNNCVITFRLPQSLQPYVFPKGYIGLNGASLTIGEDVSDRFSVYLIPETLKLTTFCDAKVGDKINVEIDSQTQAVVDTVERILASKKANSNYSF